MVKGWDGGALLPHFPEEKTRHRDCSARSVSSLLTLPRATWMLDITDASPGVPLKWVPLCPRGGREQGCGAGCQEGKGSLTLPACRALGHEGMEPTCPSPAEPLCVSLPSSTLWDIPWGVCNLPGTSIYTIRLVNAAARPSLPPPLLEGWWLNIHPQPCLAQASGIFPIRQQMPLRRSPL